MSVHIDQMTTLEKKIQHFSRILSQRPGDELTILALAEASFRRGLKLEALTAYQDVVGGRPVPEAHLAVAEIYFAQGMPNEAYGEIRRLFELDPDNVEARLLINALQEDIFPPEDLREIMQRATTDEAFEDARLRLKIQRTIYNRELQERTRNVTLEPGTVIHEYYMEEAKKKLIRVDELLRELDRFQEYNQTLVSEPPRPDMLSGLSEPEADVSDEAAGSFGDESSELSSDSAGDESTVSHDEFPLEVESSTLEELETAEEALNASLVSSLETEAIVVEDEESLQEQALEFGSGLESQEDFAHAEEPSLEQHSDKEQEATISDEPAGGGAEDIVVSSEEDSAEQFQASDAVDLLEEASGAIVEAGVSDEAEDEATNGIEAEAPLASGEGDALSHLDLAPLPVSVSDSGLSQNFASPDFHISMDTLEPDLPDLSVETSATEIASSIVDLAPIEMDQPGQGGSMSSFEDGVSSHVPTEEGPPVDTSQESESDLEASHESSQEESSLDPGISYASSEFETPMELSPARKAFYETHHEALSSLTTTLARTRGVTSIYLVAREGVTIDAVAKDNISEKRVGELVCESFEFLEAFAKDPTYWVLECAGGIFVMQRLDERHVLIAIGQAGANFGALRYTMDKTRTKFEQLLAQAPQ